MKFITLVLGSLAVANCFQIRAQNNLAINDPQECVAEKCPNEWKACQKDSKCIPTIQGCQKKCGSKQTCWEFCLSKAGDQNAINVAKCAAKENCLKSTEDQPSTALVLADPQECVAEKCPNEWKACQKDSKCIPTIQGCQKKCGSKQTCWEFCLSKARDQNAINVAKCAAKENCLKQTPQVFIHPFEKCVANKCTIPFVQCQKDQMCAYYMDSCTNNKEKYNFNFDCLLESSSYSPKLKTMFDCVGHHKCI